MSKSKVIALAIIACVGLAALTAHFFWNMRRDGGNPAADRSLVVATAARELGYAWRSFVEAQRKPPVDLDELSANDARLVERLRPLLTIGAGDELNQICRYVRPVAQPMPSQPLFVIRTGGKHPESDFVVRANGALHELAPAEVATWWTKAGELAALAAKEDRGITAAEWGVEFIE